jgi:beta-galactosidase
VKGGGHVLAAFKSGFCNENSTVRPVMAPGPLRAAAGFRYQEFSTLTKPMPLRGDPFKAGAKNEVSVWAEFLIPETAKPLAFYDHEFFGRWPAITRNSFGKGTLTYEGTILSDELQEKVVRDVLADAGIPMRDAGLPPGIRTKHAVAADGRPLHFFYNFSGQAATFVYGYKAGADVLAGEPVAAGAKITLAPWDLLIVKATK